MKLIHILSYIVIACTLSVLLVVGYWLFYPFKVFTFLNDMPKLEKETYHAGEVLRWDVDIYQHTNNKKVSVIRQLQNDVIVNLPETSYITKKGRQTFRNAGIIIPEYAPAGNYTLSLTSKVHINPLRDVTFTKYLPFKVIEKY